MTTASESLPVGKARPENPLHTEEVVFSMDVRCGIDKLEDACVVYREVDGRVDLIPAKDMDTAIMVLTHLCHDVLWSVAADNLGWAEGFDLDFAKHQLRAITGQYRPFDAIMRENSVPAFDRVFDAYASYERNQARVAAELQAGAGNV